MLPYLAQAIVTEDSLMCCPIALDNCHKADILRHSRMPKRPGIVTCESMHMPFRLSQMAILRNTKPH